MIRHRLPRLLRAFASASAVLAGMGALGWLMSLGPAAKPLHAQPDAACRTERDKLAEPTRLRLGQEVTVTLAVSGDCPDVERVADVVLVIDASLSMRTRDGGFGSPTRLERAKEAARVFVDQMDPTLVQVGVIAFYRRADVVHRLSDDHGAVKRAIDGISIDRYTNLVDALEAGRRMAIGRDHRPAATPVIVFLTDGEHTMRNPPFSAIDTVIAAVRRDGIETYAIGLEGSQAWVLRRIAGSPSRYLQTPDSAQLAAVYRRIAARIRTTTLFRTLTVEDEIPANMTYLNGSAEPPAFFDAPRRTLIWRVDDVPSAGADLRYRLRPEELGEHPTNVEATGRFTDGLGVAGSLRFPVPRVTVVDAPAASCVCRVTHDRVPSSVIDTALADPARVYGWNRLLDEGKPGAPPFPEPGHDRPPNPRRTCLDLSNRVVPYHPSYNPPVWRAGCLIGPAARP